LLITFWPTLGSIHSQLNTLLGLEIL